MNTQNSQTSDSFSTVSQDVDDAVGVAGKHWFVAIVNHNTEHAAAEKLDSLGFESYVASQQELRIWRNGRRRMVNRVVIPCMVFVRCTERERMRIVNMPFILRFLSDKAAAPNELGRRIAQIPEQQMDMLKFMLGNADSKVEIVGREYGRGDHIRVVRGKLRGAEGEVIVSANGRGELIVSIGMLGFAKCNISMNDIEPFDEL